MKSYMAKPEEVKVKWYIVDAEGMVLGRLASQVASILRGKTEPTFTPHVDTGKHVVIINSDKVVLTGKKLEQKFHRTHTGNVGNLHETQYKKLMAERSDFVVLLAIKGMLPKSALGSQMLKKVRVYKDANHEQQAQMPEKIELVR
ncbi:MAG: 50S ribosomal protein L13 [Clostridia bacterium]|nr:50S ribosomal protein L13 [Clostridia bacterium]